jgi:alkylhydroperoxidase family enzyme
MPRIHPLGRDEMGPEARALVEEKESRGLITDNAMIQAHQPAMSRAWDQLAAAINTEGTLPARLLELLRLRIAFHNQCRTCMSLRYLPEDQLDEGVVCSLAKPEEADDLTEAERSALRFADLFATNHLAIDDAVYDDQLRLGVVAATWDVMEGLPEDYQGDRAAEPLVYTGGGDVLRAAPATTVTT